MHNTRTIIEQAIIPLHNKIIRGKTLAGTTELLNVALEFDPTEGQFIDLPHKNAPRRYIASEIDWYESQDRCITGHPLIESNPIWQAVADSNSEVNSNYGKLIFEGEPSQFDKAINELILDPETRRACMVYMPKDMHERAVANGGNDFTCTYATNLTIRDGKLNYQVNMRSNDLIFGLICDYAWHWHVYQKVKAALQDKGITVDDGSILWHAGSLHVYERHYKLIFDIVDSWRVRQIDTIVLEGIDRVGKTTALREFGKIDTQKNWMIYDRGLMSHITYDRIYKRTNTYCPPPRNVLYIRLTLSKSDWSKRFDNHEPIEYFSHNKAFEDAAKLITQMGGNVTTLDVSNLSQTEVGEKIMEIARRYEY